MNHYKKGYALIFIPVILVSFIIVGAYISDKTGYKQTNKEKYLSKDEKMAIKMYKQGCKFKGYIASNSSSTTGVGLTLDGKAGVMAGSTESKEQYHYSCQNNTSYIVNFDLVDMFENRNLMQFVNKEI